MWNQRSEAIWDADAGGSGSQFFYSIDVPIRANPPKGGDAKPWV